MLSAIPRTPTMALSNATLPYNRSLVALKADAATLNSEYVISKKYFNAKKNILLRYKMFFAILYMDNGQR